MIDMPLSVIAPNIHPKKKVELTDLKNTPNIIRKIAIGMTILYVPDGTLTDCTQS